MHVTILSRHSPPQQAVVPAGVTRIRRPSVNITPAERLARRAIGTLAVVAGAFLLASAAPAMAVVLELALIAAGLDLVITGALGHSPLYHRLGYVPKSLRRTS